MIRGRFFDLFPKDENREIVIEKPPIKKPCYWQTNFVTKGCVKITIFAPDYLGLRITL